MNMVNQYSHQKLFLIAFLILLPSIVLAECDQSYEDDKSEALKYKIGAITSILVAGLIGVCLPILGKKIPSLSPETNLFFIIKAFAAGVILATGFMHVLPDAFEDLGSLEKSPWCKFPFAAFVAMMAAIVTLLVDVSATSHYQKRVGENYGRDEVEGVRGDEENYVTNGVPVHAHVHHGHAHGHLSSDGDSLSTKLRYRVISQVLELGIIVHSVIIGITLGVSDSPKEIKPLVAALTFHQFFEGIGLGGCITQAKFKTDAVITMALFFSLTTPVGIGIGMGIKGFYGDNDSNAHIVQGIFNSASAGILIYMALVDLLSADFMNPKMQSNGKLQLGASISLLLGAGFMSLLAYWA